MDPHYSEWLGLVVRWVHVITGIAWIGASFYFNWLLNRLLPPPPDERLATGELWAIHAGGFFKVQKRRIPPGELPEPLHWFKWEAYWTWISGFALLVLVYYLGASAYLIDPSVADISPATAIGIGLASLVVSWLVYDLLWSSRLAAERPRISTALSLALLALLTWGLGEIFSGRGAYIHVGAVIGTLMVGNVFRVIMPAQRQLVAATHSGGEQDAALAANAERRSLHNNYMTLPVLFIMVSNHYPGSYAHEHAWLVLLALFAAGTLARHYFNVRQRVGNVAPAWMLVAAGAIVAGLAWLTTPRGAGEADGGAVAFAEVRPIIEARCVSCHAESPASEMFRAPPMGVVLETPEQIRAQAPAIEAQTVATQAMPLGNLTGMTPEERELLGRWIRAGARIE